MTNSKHIFPVILLVARPAAGKSEIIEYLSNQSDDPERENDYHIGQLTVIDDFPFLWRWFEEDDLLERMGKERLYTDKNGYFKDPAYWDLLIQLINLEYEKSLRDTDIESDTTTIIEFSRGKEQGGYRHAFSMLSDQILEDLTILYVDVPWEESLRKNRSRFNPERPDSILEHSLPDEKLERLYRWCDFSEIAHGNQGFVNINKHDIPFVVFYNYDDVTTKMNDELGKRLKFSLGQLWKIKNKS
jgi:hypothetical protein